jgi:hypothetical protein
MSGTTDERNDFYPPWVIEDEADAGRPRWFVRQARSALRTVWRHLLEGRPGEFPPQVDRLAEGRAINCSAAEPGGRTAANKALATCQLS